MRTDAGLFIILCIVAISVIGLLIVRRFVTVESRKRYQEVAGFVISVLGSVYGVLLAFVVILVWGQFEDAKKSVSSEANQLGDLMLLSRGLPEPAPEALRIALLHYAQLVVSEEWPMMANGERSSVAQDAFDNLWFLFRKVEPKTPREISLYSDCLERLSQLSDDRRQRLHASRDIIPSVIWIVLWVGGILTVGFSYLFGIESFRSHALMSAALSAEIALILFLVFVLDNPFRGDFRITPASFEYAIERLVQAKAKY
jgi:hypothetical protein